MSELKVDLDAGLAEVDNAPSLTPEQKDATKRILRAFAGVEEKEKTYRRGNKFQHSQGVATLTCIGNTTMLMAFANGCWGGTDGGAKVVDVFRITEGELAEICGGHRSNYTLKETEDD